MNTTEITTSRMRTKMVDALVARDHEIEAELAAIDMTSAPLHVLDRWTALCDEQADIYSRVASMAPARTADLAQH